MSTENIAALIPRLKALGRKVDDHVCLELDVWVRPREDGRIDLDVKWQVWDGHEHYTDTTPERALQAAKVKAGLRESPVPDLVVMPDASEV